MRARNIKPGFFKNEKLAECDYVTRLLFIGLWCMADRDGRLEKRPLRIKAEVFPYDSLDINRELTVIERMGFVKTYRVDGKDYLQVLKFDKHQRPHHTEAKSKLPVMTEENKITVNTALDNGEYPPDSLIHRFTDSLIQKPTTTTAAEIYGICFLENENRIKELYPHANYEVEKETFIAHYRGSNPPLDAYPIILKWFNRIASKPSKLALVDRQTESEKILAGNAAACREFVERGVTA